MLQTNTDIIINVTNKHRHQNNRMVNEIKRTKQNKQSKKGNVKII